LLVAAKPPFALYNGGGRHLRKGGKPRKRARGCERL